MDTEVSRTLAELERKLHDLERALTSIGDNERREGVMHAQAASPYLTGERQASGARLVDETLDVGGVSEQAHAGPPAAGDESIELAELVRFRDRLEHAMRELVEDYERIIRLRSASGQHRAPIDER